MEDLIKEAAFPLVHIRDDAHLDAVHTITISCSSYPRLMHG